MRDVWIGCDQGVDAPGPTPDRNVLFAVLLPRDGLTGYPRWSLELPEDFSGVRIDRDEFAGELAGEDQPTLGHQRAANIRALERRLPFRLAGERVDGAQIAALLGVKDIGKLHAEPEFARLEVDRLLGRQSFVVHTPVERVDIKQSRRRVERHRRPVLSAMDRRIDPCLAALGDNLLGLLAPHRASGLRVDAVGPVDRDELVGGQQLAGRAFKHIEEAVAARLHDDLARRAGDRQIGLDQLIDPVVVVRIIRSHLVMPDHFAGLGPNSDDRIRVEVVAFPVDRIPRRRIADAPEYEVELGIIGAGDPGRAAAGLPGLLVGGPGLGALLTAFGDRIGAPQRLAGLRIEALEIAAYAVFGARDAGDHHAVRDQRCDRHRVAVLGVLGFGAPDLLAGLLVERDHIGVERGAVELAVEQRTATIDDAAADDPCRLRRIFDHGLPDFLAGQGIDRDGFLMIGNEDHTVLDQGLGLHAPVVAHAVRPRGHQPLDVLTIDLCQRAIAVLRLAHAVAQHVARVLLVILEIVRGLGECRKRKSRAQHGSQHRCPDHDVSSILMARFLLGSDRVGTSYSVVCQGWYLEYATLNSLGRARRAAIPPARKSGGTNP